jgi:DNA-directed RNA polymerase subunit K/omega
LDIIHLPLDPPREDMKERGMTEKKAIPVDDPMANKYISVLAASKRARQLLDRAEKHNLTVDTEKVILQALNEFVGGKVLVSQIPTPGGKKRSRD